jgi:hypothetical protein
MDQYLIRHYDQAKFGGIGTLSKIPSSPEFEQYQGKRVGE